MQTSVIKAKNIEELKDIFFKSEFGSFVKLGGLKMFIKAIYMCVAGENNFNFKKSDFEELFLPAIILIVIASLAGFDESGMPNTLGIDNDLLNELCREIGNDCLSII